MYMKTRKISTIIVLIIVLTIVSGCLQGCFNFNNDYNELQIVLENLSKKYMSANIRIANNSASGSGVIFKEDENYYYALTNYHVVQDEQLQIVSDYVNNEYETGLLNQSRVKVLCVNSSYDLAVIRFYKRESYPLTVLSLAEKDVRINDKVIAIGAPKNNINAVTCGKILNTKTSVKMNDKNSGYSKVNFEVLLHDAFINEGSSGGLLMNYNYQIVGINFAVTQDDKGNVDKGVAIPVSKVKEFLQLYNVTY